MNVEPSDTDKITFPCDPLQQLMSDAEFRRRTIEGILESYNSNYDMLGEAVQNAVDALEDAALLELSGPYVLHVTVDLSQNRLSVLDTGIGLSAKEMMSAFAPSVSFKRDSAIIGERKKREAAYRGYKGVGLTYIAYGTDHVAIHSKRNGVLNKARMQHGRSWATGKRNAAATTSVAAYSSRTHSMCCWLKNPSPFRGRLGRDR